MKCHWCDKKATKTDYREVDGITSKIVTCNECAGLSTEYLVTRRYDKLVTSLEEKVDMYGQAYHILMEEYFDNDNREEKLLISKKLETIGL